MCTFDYRPFNTCLYKYIFPSFNRERNPDVNACICHNVLLGLVKLLPNLQGYMHNDNIFYILWYNIYKYIYINKYDNCIYN